jgi:hypothetical protein
LHQPTNKQKHAEITKTYPKMPSQDLSRDTEILPVTSRKRGETYRPTMSERAERNISNHRMHARLIKGLAGSLNDPVDSADLSAERLIHILFARALGKKRLDIQQDDNLVSL